MPQETSTKQKTILLVEGDDNYSFFFSQFLQPRYNVIWAHDAKQGLRLAGQLKPDLILLEIILKGEDGFEVLKKLKLSELTQKIPVAVVTNLAHHEDRQEAVRLGACEYILKEKSESSKICEIIEKHLKDSVV